MTRKNTDIALFIGNLEVGGAELTMLHLSEGFADQGLTVDLVVVRATGPLLKKVPANVRIVNLDCPHVYSSVGKLIQYLRRERPKGLISALESPNLVAILARWFSGVRFRHVITINSFASLVYKSENADVFTRTLRARLAFRAMKILYRFANNIVAISSGVADDISKVAKIARQRVQVFYLPVITPNLEKRMREPVDHEWFRPGEPPVVIAVGRLAAAKDYPTLIKAFSILQKRRSARLMIIGEGELRPELEKLVRELGLEDKVLLPGYIENQYAYMAHASVFVLSSAWEGLSMVLVEALACGVKVVSTNCHAGPSEILEDGKWGKLVPVGDFEAMASAIEETLASPKTSPPKEALERFTLETLVRRYRKLLLE